MPGDMKRLLAIKYFTTLVFHDLSATQGWQYGQFRFGHAIQNFKKKTIKTTTLKGNPFSQLVSNFKFNNILRYK